MNAALVIALGLVAPISVPDTTVELTRGDRLVIENVSGEIVVESWSRDVAEIAGEERRDRFEIRRRDGVVEVRGQRGRDHRSVDITLRVPTWVDLEIRGRSVEVDVTGLEGDLTVANVNGEINVRDVAGAVDVRTIDGEVRLEDVRGGVRVSSQSDDVTVIGAEGPIEAHSGSGDVVLAGIRSQSVRAETQDGDIEWSGPIRGSGSFAFFVHDGDAIIAMTEEPDAQVSVSTFDGEFQSDFPVVVQRFTGGREFEFVLGDGTARLQIEVFDGEIHLLRR